MTKKSAAKSKPAPKAKNEKRAQAATPAVEPVVTTAVETPAAETPEAKSAPSKIEQNGIRQPGEGTLCAKVWAALDALRAEGKDATFEAVRELAGSEMADATIRTQRQRWREFNGIKREEKPARKPAVAKAVASQEVQQPAA